MTSLVVNIHEADIFLTGSYLFCLLTWMMFLVYAEFTITLMAAGLFP